MSTVSTRNHSSGDTFTLMNVEEELLLNKGNAHYQKMHGSLQAELETTVRDISDLESELDAGLQVKEDSQDEQPARAETTKQSSQLKAFARKNFTSVIDLARFQTKKLVGCIFLFFGVFLIPAVDTVMFFNQFKASFEDEFGALSTGGALLALLFSVQALGSLLAVKFFANTPKRRAALATLAFVGAILFTFGAALEQADLKVRQDAIYSANDLGFSWGDQSAVSENEPAIIPLPVSSYLLALSFVVMPLVGTLMISSGWSAFQCGFVGLAMTRAYRNNYRLLKAAIDKRNTLALRIKDIQARQDDIIKAPLQMKLAEIVRLERETKRAMRNARQGGLGHITGVQSPHDISVRYADIDAAERDVDRTLEKYGNGYCHSQFNNWRDRQGTATR